MNTLSLAEYLTEHGPRHTDLCIAQAFAAADNKKANADEDLGEMMSLQFSCAACILRPPYNFPLSTETINIISSWLVDTNAREQRIKVYFHYHFNSVSLALLGMIKDAVVHVSVYDYAFSEATIAVALNDFLSFPNLESIRFYGGLFTDIMVTHYIEEFICKAPKNLKRVQLSKNKRHIRSSLDAILRSVDKNKGIEEIICDEAPRIDKQVCLPLVEACLFNSVCNMTSLGDLGKNCNHTLGHFIIHGMDAWNNRLRAQWQALKAQPLTLGAMLRINTVYRGAMGIDDDVVMRYKINIKTVIYYLDGGGAWERDNIDDDERIGILPNLLSFVGTTAPEDNQYIADGARLGAVYRVLCSEVNLLVTTIQF